MKNKEQDIVAAILFWTVNDEVVIVKLFQKWMKQLQK